MRSIVYNGLDLSDVCSAEVIEKVALPVAPETIVVPGCAGAAVHGRRLQAWDQRAGGHPT